MKQAPARTTVNELGTIKIERKEARPMTVTIFERVDGHGYIIGRGAWFAEVRSAQLRPLLDDLAALLSDSAQ